MSDESHEIKTNNRLKYTEIEALEEQGKKYTGNQREHWVDCKSLCTTCRNAHITRRGSQNKRTVYCHTINKYVAEDISECTDYRKFTELTLETMGMMAILIDPRPDRYKGYL